jgi:hypothetical protein
MNWKGLERTWLWPILGIIRELFGETVDVYEESQSGAIAGDLTSPKNHCSVKLR